jgi:hypothetical protein
VPARACAVVGPGRDLPADLYLEGSEDRVVMLMERPALGAAHSTHRQGSSNFCRCRGLEQRCRCRPTILAIRCAVHSPGEYEAWSPDVKALFLAGHLSGEADGFFCTQDPETHHRYRVSWGSPRRDA